VCQDFALLAVPCVRANGLATSHVSGYLATDPSPGRKRMIGIDATHAWAAVWAPQDNWLGFDPTDDQMIDERYIVAGWGHDYADVSALRGIIYSESDSSAIDVSVDVAPIERDF
jgi:transglutaminase-like putative cysteine protease